MRKRYPGSALLLSAVILTVVCCSSCQLEKDVSTSDEKSGKTIVISTVESSEEGSGNDSQAESVSGETESSEKEDDTAAKTDQVKEDLKVLLAYRQSIPAVSEQKVKVVNTENTRGTDYEEKDGKLFYVDSVLRDVNDDGKMDLVVKYDCEVIDERGRSVSFLYEVVTVVDGKAVATDRHDSEPWTMDCQK